MGEGRCGRSGGVLGGCVGLGFGVGKVRGWEVRGGEGRG